MAPIDSLLTKLEKGILDDTARAMVFRTYAHDARLQAWLLGKRAALSKRNQFLLRSARSANSVAWESRKVKHMLIGLPVHWQNQKRQAILPVPAWQAAHSGFALAFEPLKAVVNFSRVLVPSDWLDNQVVGNYYAWMDKFTRNRDPLWEFRETAAPLNAASNYLKARVCVGMVTFCPTQSDIAWNLLGSSTRAGSPLHRTALRVEAICEESKAVCQVFAPTALWNSASFSRLFSARCDIRDAEGTYPRSQWHRTGARYWLSTPGSAFMQSYEFPEELPEDLPFLVNVKAKELDK